MAVLTQSKPETALPRRPSLDSRHPGDTRNCCPIDLWGVKPLTNPERPANTIPPFRKVHAALQQNAIEAIARRPRRIRDKKNDGLPDGNLNTGGSTSRHWIRQLQGLQKRLPERAGLKTCAACQVNPVMQERWPLHGNPIRRRADHAHGNSPVVRKGGKSPFFTHSRRRPRVRGVVGVAGSVITRAPPAVKSIIDHTTRHIGAD